MLKSTVLVVVLLVITSVSGHSQVTEGCAITLGDIPFDCHVGSCIANGDRFFPIGGEGDHTAVECIPISCCGQPMGQTCSIVGSCIQGQLKDPAIQRRILELAKTESVLISTCSGQFLPLEAAIKREDVPLINLHKPQPLWRSSH